MRIIDNTDKNKRFVVTDEADFVFEKEINLDIEAFTALWDEIEDAIINSPFKHTSVKIAGRDWLNFTYLADKDTYVVRRPGYPSRTCRACGIGDELLDQRLYCFKVEA